MLNAISMKNGSSTYCKTVKFLRCCKRWLDIDINIDIDIDIDIDAGNFLRQYKIRVFIVY